MAMATGHQSGGRNVPSSAAGRRGCRSPWCMGTPLCHWFREHRHL